jgi:hypothetical protein
MNNALKAKLIRRLRNALSPGKHLDAQSVKSVLIDVRDLLELQGEAERYKVLKFHCDWVLHPSLTSPRVQRIIKAVDIECEKSVQKAGLTEWPTAMGSNFFGPVPQEFIGELQARFTFYPFETEFREFLHRHQLSALPDPTSRTWREFELVYCQLIEDRSWDYTNKKIPVHFVNRVRVRMKERSTTHDRDLPAGGHAFPFCLWWLFLWNDEERLMFELERRVKRFV